MARILLVEDDRALSQVLQGAIEDCGHNVLEAFDGTSAWEIVREKPLDLVITDIFLPDKDGLELIRELKHSTPKIKIIAMTGGAGFDKDIYLRAAVFLGADSRIEKPFQIQELLSSIEELLV
jgi:DNA-binding response OmpR family regulator